MLYFWLIPVIALGFVLLALLLKSSGRGNASSSEDHQEPEAIKRGKFLNR
jgi:hypothetical protein